MKLSNLFFFLQRSFWFRARRNDRDRHIINCEQHMLREGITTADMATERMHRAGIPSHIILRIVSPFWTEEQASQHASEDFIAGLCWWLIVAFIATSVIVGACLWRYGSLW